MVEIEASNIMSARQNRHNTPPATSTNREKAAPTRPASPNFHHPGVASGGGSGYEPGVQRSVTPSDS
jgi:hypothetical protein